MKFFNCLLLFFVGVVFVFLGFFLFINLVVNFVVYSWWIVFGLLVFFIAVILGYFFVLKEFCLLVYFF